jgi:TrmH family RNA methyltransferase
MGPAFLMLNEITSLQNPKVKLARSLERRKAREEAGLFLVEGTKLLGEALANGFAPATTFATAAWWATKGQEAPFAGLAGERFAVPEAVLAAVATTETPDGVAALLPLPGDALPELAPDALVAIAHRLQDPGNLGTIVRAADAAGAAAVFVTEGTVDPWSPKAVRATMGSCFHLPVVRTTLPAFRTAYPALPLYALTLRGASSLYGHDLTAGAAFLVGNEGAGLDEAAEDLADHRVKLPIPGRAESLNAAMAATICLYEAVRQRQMS